MYDLHGGAFLPPEDRGGGGRVEVDVELLGVVDVVFVVVVESKRFRQIYQSICLVVVLFLLMFLLLNVLYIGQKYQYIYLVVVVVVVELLEVELLPFAALCSSPSTARSRCPAVQNGENNDFE